MTEPPTADRTPAPAGTATPPKPAGYRVLARAYRPRDFSQLIGQEALVRTLSNAIQSGRVAHAFMLTGVRGVGKTTTARIIAKALNYVGPDGTGGPSLGPFEDCPICQAITEDRHVDVIEMDAASRTGVDDIRELIEGVRYRPVEARYKVYIIDEVHMLSKNAFNALLKTLEEPPEHVKFIFATTEIRKVPVTILSRCQRFDLRRVGFDALVAHFTDIAGQESVTIETEAIRLIARAADGSVRDGLSLLDQAIALGDGTVATETVRGMLGLADRSLNLDLLTAILGGKSTAALQLLDQLHGGGADPVMVVQDLLELVHFVTRVKAVPEAAEADGVAESERDRCAELAQAAPMSILARLWQMLLRGLAEVQQAPLPQQALEMVVLRLIHAGDLPSPAELVRSLSGEGGTAGRAGGGPRPGSGDGPGTARAAMPGGGEARQTQPAARPLPTEQPRATLSPPEDFPAMVRLLEAQGEVRLAAELHRMAHPVDFEIGRIALRLADQAPRDLAGRLTAALQTLTGRRWMISLHSEGGGPSLAELEAAAQSARMAEAARHPVVAAILSSFPGARIGAIRDLTAAPDPAGPGADAPAIADGEDGAVLPDLYVYDDIGQDPGLDDDEPAYPV